MSHPKPSSKGRKRGPAPIPQKKQTWGERLVVPIRWGLWTNLGMTQKKNNDTQGRVLTEESKGEKQGGMLGLQGHRRERNRLCVRGTKSTGREIVPPRETWKKPDTHVRRPIDS